ncbi:longevity assurance proteins LAG1 LAC1 [Pluteus cervinus]|uniref:Longevity assurance proteins LAG1 LAC1 n=1 Tax=Pluteus cervinus TaxID=181527 RepID=A0ACD3BDB3_9AGAR|nr:longevity assurance proteins LAG1 LAC1 [Pluteus cervinus]
MSQNTHQSRPRKHKVRKSSEKLQGIEDDPDHHLAGPFLPQTPIGSLTPIRSGSPAPPSAHVPIKVSPFLRWIVDPVAAFKLLLFPIVLWANWELIAPYTNPSIPNPFSQFFLLSHRVPESSSDDPRYAKGWSDLVFLGYYIVFWSCVRQVLSVTIGRPLGQWFGLRREAKLDRFGEQLNALAYYAVFGFWGCRIMSQLPTWWYASEHFWIGYPHWDMKPELKAYYLTQLAHWTQELLGLILGLEKPRKDFRELFAHHLVTIWLVAGSYLVNTTVTGNAVFVSMDIPDAFFAFSKILNYIQWNNAKVYTFIFFFFVWTYFRHYLSLVIIVSVWTEWDLIPPAGRIWSLKEGTYLVDWVQYQALIPLLLLQGLNLFWYYLILRVLYRAVVHHQADDDRSDDEGEDPKED